MSLVEKLNLSGSILQRFGISSSASEDKATAETKTSTDARIEDEKDVSGSNIDLYISCQLLRGKEERNTNDFDFMN